MPNIVAARPVAGAMIDDAWGGEVHDRVEAVQLIQWGHATIVFNNQGDSNTVVVFPIPFASPPVVVCCFEQGSTLFPGTGNVTATQAQLNLRHYNNTAQTNPGLLLSWMAVGTAVA